MTGKKKEARPPRGRRPLPDAERKGRVVQTRVPENLDETLKDEAKKRRVSVSQLIRNVLEDTFNLVDDVVAGAQSLAGTVKRDALKLAASAKGEPRAAKVKPWAFHFEEVVVNIETTCTNCGRAIRKGQTAMRGISEGPDKEILCTSCVVTAKPSS